MTLEFVLRVLHAVAEPNDIYDDLWWRTDGEYAPLTFFIKCSDVFEWGTADCEPITPENVGELEQAIADLRAIPDTGRTIFPLHHAGELFCARVRKMRPQGAWYAKILPREVWPLFDQCGEVREVGLGNPRKHPGEKSKDV